MVTDNLRNMLDFVDKSVRWFRSDVWEGRARGWLLATTLKQQGDYFSCIWKLLHVTEQPPRWDLCIGHVRIRRFVARIGRDPWYIAWLLYGRKNGREVWKENTIVLRPNHFQVRTVAAMSGDWMLALRQSFSDWPGPRSYNHVDLLNEKSLGPRIDWTFFDEVWWLLFFRIGYGRDGCRRCSGTR